MNRKFVENICYELMLTQIGIIEEEYQFEVDTNRRMLSADRLKTLCNYKDFLGIAYTGESIKLYFNKL